jgi:putative N6-adenine-specific DNA methylase
MNGTETSDNRYTLVCPCLFGTESLIADELKLMGFDAPACTNGRVTFSGTQQDIARANIGLRCAERVLIELGSFRASTFDELFEGIKALPWEDFIGREDSFPVAGWSLQSQLHSVPDCQKIVKKAVVERLKPRYRTDWFKETGPRVQIRFSIYKDEVSACLDTTGEGLHKRGYRAESTEAPIKETLAASMIKLARPFADKPFYDPMCGSGTILIETALMLRNIAPGLKRSFAAEKWGCFAPDIWSGARQAAQGAINDEQFVVQGYDTDKKAVELTLGNAEKAGVGGNVRAAVQDIDRFAPQGTRGLIVCNPPYGERLLEIKQAEELYTRMGRAFLPLPDGFHYFIISPSDRFEQLFGRKADKRRKLYNGMIKCELFQYFRPRSRAGENSRPGGRSRS